MFFYLLYNSSFIKKDSDKNKNVNTLIYGSIVYIVLHALIFANSNLKNTILRYFWIILSVDIISIFLSTEISSDIQKHNLVQDTKTLLRKKKKRDKIINQQSGSTDIKNLKKSNTKILEHDLKNEVEENRKLNDKIGNKIPNLKKNDEELDLNKTQEILNQIEKDSKDLNKQIKKVSFQQDKDEDSKSENSEGSDIELDLESFEKTLLED